MKYFALVFFAAFAATAQVVPDQYIVELSTEPVARVASREHRRLGRDRAGFEAHRARIEVEQQRVRRQIETGSAEVLNRFQTVHNAMVVHMSASEAARVRGLAGVKRVHAVRLYKPLLDHSLRLQHIQDVWQQVGGTDKAGAGIKIAIIDTGVDASHPAFQDPGLLTPAGFPIVNNDTDQVYTNSKVIVARAYRNPRTGRYYSAKDVDGHGTAVAMIAAGETVTGPHGPITGVAPKAWIGSYKVFPDGGSGAPDSIIIGAIEDAVNDGMDVLNLSLGAFPAQRPADDPLVQAVENAAAAGKIVTVAAGNDGSDPNTIGSPGSAPSAISVGSSANDRIFAGSVAPSGRGSAYVALPGDGQNTDTPVTAPIVDIAQLDPTGLACSDLPANSLQGKVALILRGTCLFSDKLNFVQAAGATAAVIYTDQARPEAITPAVGSASLPVVMLSYADGSDLKANLAQNPGLTVTIDFRLHAMPANSLALSSFSSRGPNSDWAVKPDLLGVGSDIYTAAPNNGYLVGSGTSFSSPTVAGAAALLMSARPGLTAAQYRSLLVNSAGAFSIDGTNSIAVQQGGAGLLNLSASAAGTAAASPVSLSFGVGGDTVDQTRTLTVSNTGAAADTFSISVQSIGDGPLPNLSTNTVQLDPGKSRDITAEFAGSGLAPGSYQGYIVVQGTQSAVAARIPYWYGVPSQAARYLQIIDAPATARAGSVQTIWFRFVDAAGLPVRTGIDTSIVSGVDVVSVDDQDSDIPGEFSTDVKMPAIRGNATVHLELNGIAHDVVIQVN